MTSPRLVFAILATLAITSSVAAQQRVVRQGPPPKPFSSAEMSAPSVEVPMLPGEGIVVEVRINGKGPYKFSLDTGAGGGGRITPKTAEALGLPVVGEVMAGDPSGKNRQAQKVVEADSLTLGGATFHKVHLSVRELPKRRLDDPEDERDGVLGFGLFQDHLLTLDYPARRVRIEKGELPPVDDQQVVAFENRFGVPQIRMKVGDLEVDADVDSGNMNGELVLPASYIGKVALESEPKVVGKARTGFNEFDVKQAPLKGSARVGAQVVERPLVDFVEIFPHGNIGHAFLSRFAVTLDQKNRRIRFKS
ncbi:MAG TPA: retropepsin-like aspartic protease [Thermoanaerobaculia bacterium]